MRIQSTCLFQKFLSVFTGIDVCKSNQNLYGCGGSGGGKYYYLHYFTYKPQSHVFVFLKIQFLLFSAFLGGVHKQIGTDISTRIRWRYVRKEKWTFYCLCWKKYITFILKDAFFNMPAFLVFI